jgi:hypothetical protein
MASKDVYLELLMVFVIYFVIINVSKSIGEQLIFMFVAFTLSNVIGTLFVTGIKGYINHPLISRINRHASENEQAKEEKLQVHEMSYIFLVFFIFIIISTLAGTLLSNTVVNDVLLPGLGATQGELLISGIITLATYVQMLYLFGEKLLNPTSMGLIAILIAMLVAFVVFGGYVSIILGYFGTPFQTLIKYVGMAKG